MVVVVADEVDDEVWAVELAASLGGAAAGVEPDEPDLAADEWLFPMVKLASEPEPRTFYVRDCLLGLGGAIVRLGEKGSGGGSDWMNVA